MTLNNSLLTLILFSGLFSSCKKDDNVPPKANFVVYNSGCIAPCDVYFFDESERGASYSWDFGNGITSELKDDTVRFEIGGYYEVSFKVTAENGETDLIKKGITVLSADTMFISSIELQSYKTLTTGWVAWDLDETLGEDFYFNILENGNLIYTSDTSAYSNKFISDLPLSFSTDQILAEEQGDYEIRLYDKDTSSTDDLLGSISFSPIDYNNSNNPNPPSQVILENSADSLRILLNLVWLN